MPQIKREEAGSLSEYERQKLQGLYMQDCAAYGSVRNLVKASNLSLSKVRHFLNSEPSHRILTLDTPKFKRMKAFAKFRNEIRCMDLAYVDQLTKKKQWRRASTTSSRTVWWNRRCKRHENKTVQWNGSWIFNYDYERESIQKNWVDKGTKAVEEYEKPCKAEGIKFILQRKRLRLHLLNVQNDHGKIYSTVTWKTMDTGTFTKFLISSHPWIPEKIAR